MRQEKVAIKDKGYSGEEKMKYRKFMSKIKRQNLRTLDISRVLGISEKELKDKLKGKKPLYLSELEALFGCLGIESGEEKIKFF